MADGCKNCCLVEHTRKQNIIFKKKNKTPRFSDNSPEIFQMVNTEEFQQVSTYEWRQTMWNCILQVLFLSIIFLLTTKKSCLTIW